MVAIVVVVVGWGLMRVFAPDLPSESAVYESVPGPTVNDIKLRLERDWSMEFDAPHEVASADGEGSWNVLDGKRSDPDTGADLVCQIGYFSEDAVWSVGYYVEWMSEDGSDVCIDREGMDRLSDRYLRYCAAIPFDGSDAAATCSMLAEVLPQAEGTREMTQSAIIVNVWSTEKLCTRALEIEHVSTHSN